MDDDKVVVDNNQTAPEDKGDKTVDGAAVEDTNTNDKPVPAEEETEEMEETEFEIMEALINSHFLRLTGVARLKYFRRYDLKVTVPPATDANVKVLEKGFTRCPSNYAKAYQSDNLANSSCKSFMSWGLGSMG